MRRRDGITKVEVLLVAAILFLLAGLILPAISKVREAEARTRSQNNLKQIVLGVHNYNDAYRGRLPPLVDHGPNAPTGTGLRSLFFIITPYLESDPAYSIGVRGPRDAYDAHSSVTFPFKNKDGSPGTISGGAANQIWRCFISPADDTALEGLRDVPV